MKTDKRPIRRGSIADAEHSAKEGIRDKGQAEEA